MLALRRQGEEVLSGIGAVLFAPDGRPTRFFPEKLSASMISRLNPGEQENCNLRMWVLCIALCIHDLGRQSLVVLQCFIQTIMLFVILWFLAIPQTKLQKPYSFRYLPLECIQQVTPWYARVPTDSNMSDAPSRFETSQSRLRMGTIHDHLDLESCWVAHSELAEQWGEDRASCTSQRWKQNVLQKLPQLVTFSCSFADFSMFLCSFLQLICSQRFREQ